MIVQTSPILGGGARCHSPLGPLVTTSADVSQRGQLASPLDSPKVILASHWLILASHWSILSRSPELGLSGRGRLRVSLARAWAPDTGQCHQPIRGLGQSEDSIVTPVFQVWRWQKMVSCLTAEQLRVRDHTWQQRSVQQMQQSGEQYWPLIGPY